MAHDVFHHDDRAVHHHAEIQRAQRQQIRGNVTQVEADGSKQQRKRNRQRDDERAAHIAQKQEQNDHDQNDSFGQVVQHRVRRVVHQIAAIQIRNDLHARRQDVHRSAAIDLGVDRLQRGGGVRALAQKHDSFDHVIVVDDSVGIDESPCRSGRAGSSGPA